MQRQDMPPLSAPVVHSVQLPSLLVGPLLLRARCLQAPVQLLHLAVEPAHRGGGSCTKSTICCAPFGPSFPTRAAWTSFSRHPDKL